MQLNFLPSRFSQTPQQAAPLDLSNPLSRKIAHSYGQNVLGSYSAYDAAGTAHGSFGAGTAGMLSGNIWRNDSYGPYINFDDAGTGSQRSVALAIGDANGSGSPGNNSSFGFSATVFITGYTTTGGELSGSAACVYGSTTGGIEFRVNSNGNLQLLKAGTTSLGISSGVVPLFTRVDIGFSWLNGVTSFYINGVLAGTASASGQTFTLQTQYYLGYTVVPSTYERLTNGSRIYRATIFNSAPSAAEMRAITSAPNQVYRAPSRSIFVATAGATDTSVAPGPASVAFTGYAPTVIRGVTTTVAPAPVTMTFTGYAPSVSQLSATTISPTAAQIAVTGYVPMIARSGALIVTPSPGALVLAGYAPTIVRGTSQTFAPAPMTLQVTGYAPFISQMNNLKGTVQYRYMPRSKLEEIKFA